ncbi:MAG: hypothetical protein JO316_08915 [Abitibacteriaceae bacterium]|nr:hypothetical protein [Abditibacteriaceae bacterium]MBV9865456.1 hypothetical protein [Abditibacteriaceae bacterium]
MRIAKQILGKPFHYGGKQSIGWLPANACRPLPTPERIIILNAYIVRGQYLYYLLWRPVHPVNLVDSPWIDDWDSPHESVEIAQYEAQEKYGIAPDEWSEPPADAALLDEEEP